MSALPDLPARPAAARGISLLYGQGRALARRLRQENPQAPPADLWELANALLIPENGPGPMSACRGRPVRAAPEGSAYVLGGARAELETMHEV